MMRRRGLLTAGGAASLAALSTGLGTLWGDGSRAAAGGDYRALVVLFLNGGNDGHNLLVPTDGAYGDYQTARANLALPKNSLLTLPGTSIGHSFGVHPSLAAMHPMYGQQRLVFIANVGPLVMPATATQVLANAVEVPPFLMSHNDQINTQQGWSLAEESSGWAGRGLEALPSTLRHALSAVTLGNGRMLVQGRRNAPAFLARGGSRQWGDADLAQPQSSDAQNLRALAQQQYPNAYQAEYARTMAAAIDDSTRFTQALMQGSAPTADFGGGELGERLRELATILPVMKAQGLRRQVYLLEWGGLDTHSDQRGSSAWSQDSQLAEMAKALAAFDQSNRASGLDLDVLTLATSDFGRTMRPGSGGGSEHAWGNHWFAMGGAVEGGKVQGIFPSPVLGGPDDGDALKNGRHVPTTSTDQVAATLMQWLGLPPSQFHEVFPWLVNFQQKTIPLLRS